MNPSYLTSEHSSTHTIDTLLIDFSFVGLSIPLKMILLPFGNRICIGELTNRIL
ncbi:hypothetical protein CHCC20490_0023 [Bacillus paralicheniformis]|nr:hypothetical protein CHCC20490_0023 [Bacillus paralicheniformis]